MLPLFPFTHKHKDNHTTASSNPSQHLSIPQSSMSSPVESVVYPGAISTGCTISKHPEVAVDGVVYPGAISTGCTIANSADQVDSVVYPGAISTGCLVSRTDAVVYPGAISTGCVVA